MNKILLDTHVLVWYATGEKTLSKQILHKIADAIDQQNIFIASISLWEIAMLEKKDRIILNMPCDEWIENALTRSGIAILPITPAIAVDSCNLPGLFHGDPADQLIVATTRVEEAQLVTRDEKILAYSKFKYLSALKA